MTPTATIEPQILTMESATTTDTLGSDSSTIERCGRSNDMNPILVQQMAQHKIDTFDQEADADRLVALARSATGRPAAGLQRVSRTAGRIRLLLRVGVA